MRLILAYLKFVRKIGDKSYILKSRKLRRYPVYYENLNNKTCSRKKWLQLEAIMIIADFNSR